jgi:type III secretion protein Q
LTLDFEARGLGGSIRLEPSEHCIGPGEDAVLLDSAIGPIRLSDAGAVLSLLGNLPVVVQGPYQAWYWQLVNQQLSTPITALLAPIVPILEDVIGVEYEIGCRLQVRLGEECVHAIFSTSPASLLRLLEGARWQAEEHHLGDDWDVSQPLVIGEVALTVEQFESLRPGDVLLPAISYFDIDGEGRLDLGGRHWTVAAQAHATRIVVRLTHEEIF